jgi:hypothetical protein
MLRAAVCITCAVGLATGGCAAGRGAPDVRLLDDIASRFASQEPFRAEMVVERLRNGEAAETIQSLSLHVDLGGWRMLVASRGLEREARLLYDRRCVWTWGADRPAEAVDYAQCADACDRIVWWTLESVVRLAGQPSPYASYEAWAAARHAVPGLSLKPVNDARRVVFEAWLEVGRSMAQPSWFSEARRSWVQERGPEVIAERRGEMRLAIDRRTGFVRWLEVAASGGELYRLHVTSFAAAAFPTPALPAGLRPRPPSASEALAYVESADELVHGALRSLIAMSVLAPRDIQTLLRELGARNVKFLRDTAYASWAARFVDERRKEGASLEDLGASLDAEAAAFRDWAATAAVAFEHEVAARLEAIGERLAARECASEAIVQAVRKALEHGAVVRETPDCNLRSILKEAIERAKRR